ncbi:LPS-assembly protein LptD [Teredinibacter franksiae]|uniref:LPS-assembly protein LptD n=1 Tax=Teredinibacter franksiae TaxID=2761453 RepID=UPI00162A56FA|nr:LPS-assembly protein LptD [Teredinibacter franksiae]
MPKSFARHKPAITNRRLKLSCSCVRLPTALLSLVLFPLLFSSTSVQADIGRQDSAAIPAPTPTPTELHKSSDWHPTHTLSAAQRATVSPGCDGLYIDPMMSIAASLGDEADKLEQVPLQIEADETVVREGETAQLQGNVELSQGARRIFADKMTYEIDKDLASMEGNVQVRQPGLLLHGSSAKANGTNHSAEFKDADFILHEQHLRGGAEAISQSADKVIVLENGSFTSCEPNSNTWVLEGERITIDTAGQQGSARNMKLKVLDYPILWLPYITFPVGDARKSGFLFPSISVSERNGLDLAFPYYFNLAPNYDAVLTPRLISKRGAMLEAEGRHLSTHFETEASFAILANDQGGRSPDIEAQIDAGVITEEQAKPYKGENRWLTQLNQLGGAGENWFSEINYTQASDNDYFRDLGLSSFSVQNTTHLDQMIGGGYRFSNWELSTLAQNYQILIYNVDPQYQRLPQVNLNGNYQSGALGTVLNHEYTRFDHDDDYWRDGRVVIKGQRLTTDYRLNLNKRASWGFFKPEVGVQSLSYSLDKDNLSPTANQSPSIATASASLDTGLVFEHPGGAFQQTLEPRLYYMYRSYDDHQQLFDVTNDGQAVNFDTSERTFSYSQLYRGSRFSGGDRLEDANRMTLGITSNWYHQASSEEYLSFSLGQIVYFSDQQVSLDQSINTQDKSEFAGEMRVRLGPWGRFFASSVYDSETDLFTRGTAGVQLTTEESRTLMNLGYSYVRKGTSSSTGIDQIDMSFVKPLSKQWVSMGRVNYDFTSGRELETFLGLEYNDCCYRLRLLARRWLDSNIAALTDTEDALHDQGVFFEIQFKGLGSSGAKVDAILEDSIYGYRERERRLNQ